MPQAFTKALLSGSINGKGIKVVQTATAGTLIHTAVSSTSSMDEIWLWVYNGHTATVTLTIEFGEATVPDGNIVIDIPSKQGRFLVVDGRLLQNSLVVRAFASVANVLVIDGFVNQIV
jgi:RNase P/RNase MRP subunit p29